MTDGDDRPLAGWAGRSVTFPVTFTDEGRRLLLGEDQSPHTRVAWRLAAPDGMRYGDEDAARLVGLRVAEVSIEMHGSSFEYGPGVIIGADVIENGAALWLAVDC
ncbi:hypothetical protein I0C86_40660 [Plantactinospora sp. S1510]|uniref:Uncharacterized protein n=1 Tax=Plantactinospora alkalitolerans TaxID=2789879 RepID=A0ABS0H9P4_9ACTN|nr:hypothetical protein [Plantactinospora alkalitolerans]MBF9135193.1 hypothetical protein [Plantactinospora alkalitolerans]